MQQGGDSQLRKALRLGVGQVEFEAVRPNPKLKLLDRVRGQVVYGRELRVDREAAVRGLRVESTANGRTSSQWPRGAGKNPQD